MNALRFTRILASAVIITAAQLSQTSWAQLSKGVVAYYPCDGNAWDSSGNNNHGEAYGPVLTDDRHGRPDSAFTFDGVSYYIDITSAPVHKVTAELTLALWANRASWTDFTGGAALAGNTDSGGYQIYYDHQAKQIQGRVRRNGAYAIAGLNVGDLSGGWHHIAVTYDGQRTRLYVDGQVRAMDDAGSMHPIQYSHGNHTLIGAEASSGAAPEGDYFKGTIDEVRIYDRALGDNEVASLVEGLTVTFQNGAPIPFFGGTYDGIEDAVILSNNRGNEDRNLGTSPEIWAGELARAPNHLLRELMRFDIASLDGRFQSIERVTLRLHVNSIDAAAGDWVDAYFLHPNNAKWAEGTSNYQIEEGTATWSHRIYPTTPWAGSKAAGTPDVDYLTPAAASHAFTTTITEGSAFDLVFSDVTAIERWIDCKRAGLLLKTRGENNSAISFHSSNSTKTSLRPQLIIEYTPGGPSGYEQWASANGIAGESHDGDHDRDGKDNGTEFALNRNPTSAADAEIFEIFKNGDDVVVNIFFDLPSNIPVLLEVSEDLKTWKPAPKEWFWEHYCNPFPIGTGGTWGFRVPGAVSAGRKLYVRTRYSGL